jgi:hypothetical protein
LGDYSIRLSNLFTANNTPVNNLYLDNHGGRMFNEEFTFPNNPAPFGIHSFTSVSLDADHGLLTINIGPIADSSDYPNLEIAKGMRYAFTGSFPNPIGAPIPEPSTYAALFGAAALGLACWRRVRRA